MMQKNQKIAISLTLRQVFGQKIVSTWWLELAEDYVWLKVSELSR
jgi:hypothetical protein